MKKIFLIIPALAWTLAATAQQSLTLSQQQARDMALQQNEDLQHADNARMQAELDKQIAFNAYLPQVDGSLMGIYMKDQKLVDGKVNIPEVYQPMVGMTYLDAQLKMQMHGAYMAGISLTQPIFAGGQIVASNKLAEINLDCVKEQARKTRMQVLADVDNAYWTLIAVDQKVKMLEAYKRQMDELYDETKVGVEAEMVTEHDLLRVGSKQSEIGYQLQKARNGRELCELSLCNLIGAPLHTHVVPTDTLIAPTTLSGLSEDISNRPDMILLGKQVEARKQQVKVARAGYLPTVGLMLGYTAYGNIKTKGSFTYDAGTQLVNEKLNGGGITGLLSVKVPIFHWGSEFKKVKKAQLELRNAELDYQKNARLMGIETRQAVQNLTAGYLMIETARKGREQADENLRMMKNKYDNDFCTLTDLLDAESQWQQARSNEIEALTQYKIYQTEYLRTIGALE